MSHPIQEGLVAHPDTYIYVIKDNVSGQVSPLFMCPNDNTALRQKKQFLQELPKGSDPKDFDLWAVGRFNPDTLRGNMSTDVYPVLIAAADVVARPSEDEA